MQSFTADQTAHFRVLAPIDGELSLTDLVDLASVGAAKVREGLESVVRGSGLISPHPAAALDALEALLAAIRDND